MPCADWGVFDEVRVRYAGVNTPETVARSLSSTHNPRHACCCHSPMYIPLLAAGSKKIYHDPYDGSDNTMLRDAKAASIDTRLQALDHNNQHPRLRSAASSSKSGSYRD